MIQSVLGLDFGLKKTGLAVGQTLTQTASPLGILRMKQGRFLPFEFEKILDTWKPAALVIGIPLNMDGSPCSVTQAAEDFAQHLEALTQLPVYRVDERLTTKSAKQERAEIAQLHKKKANQNSVDAYAAVLILENWLRQASKF